jgi:type IV fimbrial biogenesis protein FimT
MQRVGWRGLTMIELMITLVVLGVLAAIGAPSMYDFIMRKRVEGVADELLVDMRLMRSANMMIGSRGDTIVRLRSNTSMTCYVVYVGDATLGSCDCLTTPACTSLDPLIPAPVEVKSVRLATADAVTVRPAAGSSPFLILRDLSGLPKPAGATIALEVSAPRGGTVKVATNATGQPTICSVSGHEGAYRPC